MPRECPGSAGGEAFPVGSVFFAAVATDPATLLGYGAWTRRAEGKFIVGQDPNDTDFDAALETGGAKTTSLGVGELPAHSHGVTDPGHTHLQSPHTHVQDPHTHLQNPHSHVQQLRNTGTAGTAGAQGANTANNVSAGTTDAATAVNQNATGINQAATATNQNAAAGVSIDAAGGGGAFSRLPPYLVLYVWERTG